MNDAIVQSPTSKIQGRSNSDAVVQSPKSKVDRSTDSRMTTECQLNDSKANNQCLMTNDQ